MMHRLLTVFAATALFAVATSAVMPGVADAKTVFRKVVAKGTTLTTKNGYWVECSYSGLGTICETIYSRAKNGKFRRLAASAGKPVRANGYVEVCYDGANNATICYTVYTRAK